MLTKIGVDAFCRLVVFGFRKACRFLAYSYDHDLSALTPDEANEFGEELSELRKELMETILRSKYVRKLDDGIYTMPGWLVKMFNDIDALDTSITRQYWAYTED